MIKFFASSRIARSAAVIVLTFSTVILWNVTAHAKDTRTTTTKNSDGSVTVCQYQTDFATARDGANMIRTAWRCITTK